MIELKEFDLFPRLKDDGIVPISQGGKTSLPSLILMAAGQLFVLICVAMETYHYLNPEIKQVFEIDQYTERGMTDLEQKMRVKFNITVHDFPCIDLSLDYQDAMGGRVVDVKRGVFKKRLRQDGTPVPVSPLPNNPADILDPEHPGIHHRDTKNATATCGDCYGALPATECCDSCKDVLHAYRLKRWALPRIEQIAQCKNDPEAAETQPKMRTTSIHDDLRAKDLGSLMGTQVGPKLDSLKSFTMDSWKLKKHADAWPGCILRNTITHGTYNPEKGEVKATFNIQQYRDLIYDESQKESTSGVLNSITNFGISQWEDIMDSGKSKDKSGDDKDKENEKARLTDPKQAKKHEFELSGCLNDDCSTTDQVFVKHADICAILCSKLEVCHAWTYGTERGKGKCWFRSEGHHSEEWQFGFSTGRKVCTPGKQKETEVGPSSLTETGKAGPSGFQGSDKSEPTSGSFNAGTGADSSASSEKATEATKRRVNSFESQGVANGLEDTVGEASKSLDEASATPRKLQIIDDEETNTVTQLDDFGFDERTATSQTVEFIDEESAPRRKLVSLDDDDFFWGPYGSLDRRGRLEQKGESCQIYGHFDTSRVPGNFHINFQKSGGPGYYVNGGLRKPSSSHTIHQLHFMDLKKVVIDTRNADNESSELEKLLQDAASNNIVSSSKQYKLIPKREFNDKLHAPLDGEGVKEKVSTSQYYITVTPNTVYHELYSASVWQYSHGIHRHDKLDGYQYQANGFVTEGVFEKGIFFRYEIDPIRVSFVSDDIGPAKFLTHILGIIGGILGTMRFFCFPKVRS